MRLRTLALVILVSALLASSTWAQVGVVLNDPLQGSTIGTQENGQFVAGGWTPTGEYDCIFWHLPHSVSHGKAEFYLKGINSNECRTSPWPMNGANELFHMYDYTFNNSDYVYSGGYRDNPYKMFLRKCGCGYGANTNAMKVVYGVLSNVYEDYTSILAWNPAQNYHFSVEWGPDGNGNTVIRVYRDGVQFYTYSSVGIYSPPGHSVRIGASNRRYNEGVPQGAIFSYLKVTDISETVIPPAPKVVQPGNTQTVTTRTPVIKWNGDPHTSLQVRLSTSNDPNIGIVWDSGQVSSVQQQVTTGTLPDQTTYYAFVKLGTETGWGNWSPAGHWFKVDTSYVRPRRGSVTVTGNCLQDDGGKFLGLGFSHMRALNRCRYDRLRYQNDLSDMASKGFNYQRILSMVDWDGLEIMPGWSDYDQQLKDAIDIAYDNYGIRTQITILADAQNSMPIESDRYAHFDRILADLSGRQHKIIMIEVANEHWQNGVPDINTLRAYGAYLCARTSIPISLSSPADTSNSGIQNMYSGSCADIATVHFSRDSSELGWYNVRDCWRVYGLAGVPPVSSNEPIGPGSSVNEENDPTRLGSSAAFAWIAKLPMYCYHGRFGTSGLTDAGVDVKMSSTPGFGAFLNNINLLPPDVPCWTRNDGIESAAPFTAYCWKSGDAGDGQPNTYWTEYPGATEGCHRNIGSIGGTGADGDPFVCYVQGVLSGGVTLEARRTVTFRVYNILTGAVVLGPVVKYTGDKITLAGSASANVAYLIKGTLGIADIVPPPDVTNFTAVSNGTTNNLSWTNPTDSDFAGTMIRFRTDAYPSGPTDGTLLCNRTAAPGSNDSFPHSGVNPNSSYYYAAYAYDEIPNYATGVYTSTVSGSLSDWLNEVFDNYDNANLGGQGNWATVGVASAQVESSFAQGGTGKAALMDTVPTGQSMANQIAFTDKATGYYYMSFDVAQDATGTTGQVIGYVGIYGSTSSTEIARLHVQKGRMFMEYGTGSLATLTTTAGSQTWYNVKIGFNVDTRKFDLWLDGAGKGTNYNWKGTGTNLSRMVMMSDRNMSLNPQKIYIDNVKLEPKLTISAVTDDGSWTPSLDRLHFNITPVADALQYQYAIGTTSGGTQIRGWTSCGTSTDYTAAGLTLTQSTPTYYISAQASMYGNWGPTASANGIKVAPGLASIQAAKALADGAPTDVKALRGKIVTGVFPACFYIQEPGSLCGIRIMPTASVAPGNEVDVSGVMKGSGAERYVDTTGCGIIKTAPGPGLPETVVLSNASIGGAEMNSNTPGVIGGIGPNNIGLYVTAYGVVTQRQTTDPKYFYIDDGCGLKDGTTTGGSENVGVRVIADPAGYAEGAYVSVTGIVSCFDSGGLRPQMLPASIQILRAP
ncbi:MAG: hypothetical protein Q7T82_15285 [Armatimonadota bacterium]|nr:hypothetical protein [Armatimonadota bacterium]